MKRYKEIIITLFFLSFIFFPIYYNFDGQEFAVDYKEQSNFQENFLKTSDIAGTDLYAEQINALVAGNKSVIKQSLFTNDTSILSNFDTRDPAFYKCNVLFSASNGITPELFPRVLTEDHFSNQYETSFNRFSGFLYYDEEMIEEDVLFRANRALDIIKKKFEIDLIMINTSNAYFFPFVGNYPNWEIYFAEITKNLPMDGYWKALDVERLTSEEYINTQHLSSTFLLVNSLDFLDYDIHKSIDQVNFNIDSLDLGYLENLEVDNVFSQFSDIIGDSNSLFGNFSDAFNQTSTQNDFSDFGDTFSSLTLSNESHYTSLMIQYEGSALGITEVSEDEYRFNLWDALGYKGESLKPSEKIFISLIGAFMSEINVNIFCTDVSDATPSYFTLYDFLLEQIGLLLYYAEVDFDIQALKDYSFELFWVNDNGFKQSYVKPVNLNDQADIINFLHAIGIQGLPGIPTGIFNPIEEIVITYKISNSEPNLLITKDLIGGNSSNGVFNDFSFNITATNVGNETAWGVPTSIPIELDDIFPIIVGPIGVLLGLDEDLKESIWEVVRIEYAGQYTSLEDFFNFDKNPRIFYFDTTGAGVVDIYFPNLNNLSNFLPYNENMEHVIDLIAIGNPQLISSLDAIGQSSESLKDTFTNEQSIWNSENWKLEPNEAFSYTYDNFSIEGFDTFSSFYRYNFTLKENFPQIPSIISGISIGGTSPQMALNNDNQDWIVESEQKYIDQHEIEVHFLFMNDTVIDLTNNSLDSISIIVNYTDTNNALNFEVFNFSSEVFQDISPYLTTTINNTSTYTFIKNQGTLEWIFDPANRNNHSIILKIKGINSNKFNISINDLDIEFSYRDVNEYAVLGSRVLYTSLSGKVEYAKVSNTFSLSTYNMASITSYAYLSSYSSSTGEINNYTLVFSNIGSNTARNINISIMIPGIIHNPFNFTIEKDYLNYKILELAPNEKKQISFSFYIPNTATISNTTISYNNLEFIQNLNSKTLESHPNDVYFSAPIDYLSRNPYVRTIEIYCNSTTLAPDIDEIFNLSIYIKNIGFNGLMVPNLSLSFNDQYGNLAPIGEKNLVSPEILYNESIIFNISLKKVGWKGYYYPSVNFFSCLEENTVQIASSKPLILGFINFSILKSINRDQIEIGDIITVNITITNTGNICAKNITISDAIGFTNLEFELISGSLIYTATSLQPDEKISFSYKIQATKQALILLKPASIEYFYLQKVIETSNSIEVKIIIPEEIYVTVVVGPSLAALTALTIFTWKTKRYKAKKHELQRNELQLFKVSHSESVLKVEITLRDQLDSLSKEQSRNKKSNEDRGEL
ncbi:MAG: DUF7507 domain-containing protein [Promethearchaeota archaeon]